MRVDVERDYLHHRYQILVVIPDDELVAMDPTAYDLVRRSILATEPMAVRDMVAILQIAAEWLQRHPEAEYAAETVYGEPIKEPPLAGTAETIGELNAQLAGTVACGYCGKQVASMAHLHQCARQYAAQVEAAEHAPVFYAKTIDEANAHFPAASLPAPFAFSDDTDPKESRARVTWLDRWLKRRAAKGPK
jgi:hypothetical protein